MLLRTALIFAGAAPVLLPSMARSSIDFAIFGLENDYVTGLSRDGSVIVGDHNYANGGYEWTTGAGQRDLALSVNGVSGDGSTALGFTYPANGGGTIAARWTSGTGVQTLGSNGDSTATALSSSYDGANIHGYSGSNPYSEYHLFDWQAGSGMTNRATVSFQISGLSDNGATASGYNYVYYNSGLSTAYRFTLAGDTVALSPLAGNAGALAYNVSGDGSTVVGLSNLINDAPTNAVAWFGDTTSATGPWMARSTEVWNVVNGGLSSTAGEGFGGGDPEPTPVPEPSTSMWGLLTFAVALTLFRPRLAPSNRRG